MELLIPQATPGLEVCPWNPNDSMGPGSQETSLPLCGLLADEEIERGVSSANYLSSAAFYSLSVAGVLGCAALFHIAVYYKTAHGISLWTALAQKLSGFKQRFNRHILNSNVEFAVNQHLPGIVSDLEDIAGKSADPKVYPKLARLVARILRFERQIQELKELVATPPQEHVVKTQELLGNADTTMATVTRRCAEVVLTCLQSATQTLGKDMSRLETMEIKRVQKRLLIKGGLDRVHYVLIGCTSEIQGWGDSELQVQVTEATTELAQRREAYWDAIQLQQLAIASAVSLEEQHGSAIEKAFKEHVCADYSLTERFTMNDGDCIFDAFLDGDHRTPTALRKALFSHLLDELDTYKNRVCHQLRSDIEAITNPALGEGDLARELSRVPAALVEIYRTFRNTRCAPDMAAGVMIPQERYEADLQAWLDGEGPKVYLEAMRDSKGYAGGFELWALVQWLKQPVRLYQRPSGGDAPDYQDYLVEVSGDDEVKPSLHMLYSAFHYSRLLPVAEEECAL